MVFSYFLLLITAEILGIIGVLVNFLGAFLDLFLGAEENREKASPFFLLLY